MWHIIANPTSPSIFSQAVETYKADLFQIMSLHFVFPKMDLMREDENVFSCLLLCPTFPNKIVLILQNVCCAFSSEFSSV